MSRRVNLPSADDLFRPTAPTAPTAPTVPTAPTGPGEERRVRAVPDSPEQEAPQPSEPTPEGPRKPSGRIRHDEKMTVYVTSEELLEIEQARLALRAGQGLAVDRGRLVREALSLVLGDYQTNGDGSALVRRLTEE